MVRAEPKLSKNVCDIILRKEIWQEVHRRAVLKFRYGDPDRECCKFKRNLQRPNKKNSSKWNWNWCWLTKAKPSHSSEVATWPDEPNSKPNDAKFQYVSTFSRWSTKDGLVKWNLVYRRNDVPIRIKLLDEHVALTTTAAVDAVLTLEPVHGPAVSRLQPSFPLFKPALPKPTRNVTKSKLI